MPHDTTPKPPPGGSKPYAQPTLLSKAQMEQITRAVVAALTAANEPCEQTTHSEDEDAIDENPDNTLADTLSSSSSTDTLNATIAPLQEKLQNSSDMLCKLHDFLTKFVSTKNHPGIIRCSELIVHHEAIITDTEACLSSAKEAWETQQCNRKEQLEAVKAKKAAKSKGKAPAPLTEG
jgi:cellobiose-specific phosphotransferase system component IIA